VSKERGSKPNAPILATTTNPSRGWGAHFSTLGAFGDQQAQVAQVVAGRSRYQGVANGVRAAGIELGQHCSDRNRSTGASHVVGSAMLPLTVFPSMPSEPALSTVRRSQDTWPSSRAHAKANC